MSSFMDFRIILLCSRCHNDITKSSKTMYMYSNYSKYIPLYDFKIKRLYKSLLLFIWCVRSFEDIVAIIGLIFRSFFWHWIFNLILQFIQDMKINGAGDVISNVRDIICRCLAFDAKLLLKLCKTLGSIQLT